MRRTLSIGRGKRKITRMMVKMIKLIWDNSLKILMNNTKVSIMKMKDIWCNWENFIVKSRHSYKITKAQAALEDLIGKRMALIQVHSIAKSNQMITLIGIMLWIKLMKEVNQMIMNFNWNTDILMDFWNSSDNYIEYL